MQVDFEINMFCATFHGIVDDFLSFVKHCHLKLAEQSFIAYSVAYFLISMWFIHKKLFSFEIYIDWLGFPLHSRTLCDVFVLKVQVISVG